jgi:hypothetical protein
LLCWSFRQDPRRNFDAVIGNASPYPELPIPKSRFDIEDIVAHAKRIGGCIITGDYNNKVIRRLVPNPAHFEYYVELHFGPESEKKRFEIHMLYRRDITYDGMYVWLNSIHVFKKGKPYDSPAMAGVETFYVRLTGRHPDPPSLKTVASLTRLSRGQYQVPWWKTDRQQ